MIETLFNVELPQENNLDHRAILNIIYTIETLFNKKNVQRHICIFKQVKDSTHGNDN